MSLEDFPALEVIGLDRNVIPYQPEAMQDETPPDAVKGKIKLFRKKMPELASMEFKDPEYILYPWLRVGELAFISAKAGIGKTYLALSIVKAVTEGSSMLDGRWNAPKPRRVLYVDGEMYAQDMLKRAREIGINDNDDNFSIINNDFLLEETPSIDLTNIEWQNVLVESVEENTDELIILDNLSCLYRVDKTNAAESWLIMLNFLSRLRRLHVAVIVIDHEGKGAEGSPRGTSAKADSPHVMLSLRRPGNYKTEEGARFEVHFPKSRGFYGEDAKPFEMRFERNDSGALNWVVSDIVENENKVGRPKNQDVHDRIIQLLQEGKTPKEIIETTGYSKTIVYDIFNELKKRNS